MKTRKILAGIIAIVALYLMWVGITHFWYRKPDYAIGIDTPNEIRNVRIALFPDGKIDFGAGGQAWYMDPIWPVPESMTVSMTEESSGRSYSASLPTGLQAAFRGKIVVVIQKSGLSYQAFIRAVTTKDVKEQTQSILMVAQ